MMKNSAGASGGLNTFYFHFHKIFLEDFAAVLKIAPNNRQMESFSPKVQKVQGPKKVEILVKKQEPLIIV